MDEIPYFLAELRRLTAEDTVTNHCDFTVSSIGSAPLPVSDVSLAEMLRLLDDVPADGGDKDR